jgi:integrase
MWKNEATAINARRASLVAQTTIEVSPAAWQTVAPAGPARSAGPRRQVRAIGMILILGFSAKRPEDGSRRSWGRASAPLSRRERANLAAMDETAPNRAVSMAADILPPDPMPATSVPALTPAGQAALDAAQVLARKATAPATLRAYKADWSHFAEWCAAHGFVPVPAAPTTVGAYLASLAGSHAPTTIRRRLSALGKMHRFNDLAWNPAHRDIQGPLQGLLRTHGRPLQKAAALTLPMLRQILATCDDSARGRRDRALLLFGFAGALRRSELVALRVEDVAVVAGGLRLRIVRGKTDQAGQGAEIGLPRGRHVETCPVRAFEAWQAVARRKAGPLFRKISTGGGIGDTALHPDAVRRILAHRLGMAGIATDGFDRLSAHALRVGFITEAYDKGMRDEDIMRHTRQRDPRSMRGYVRRAGLVRESPASVLDL